MWLMLGGIALVVAAGLIWAVFGRAPQLVKGPAMVVPAAGFVQVGQETAGTVEAVFVRPGQDVVSGARIAQVRTASNERLEVRSPVTGRVAAVLVQPGVVTVLGTSVAILVAAGGTNRVLAFLPAGQAKRVRVGMPALVELESVPRSQYGMIEAKVVEVAEVPATNLQVRLRVGENDQLAAYFTAAGPVIEVAVDLVTDPATASGLRWTVGAGPAWPITPGTLATVGVVLASGSPLDSIL